MSLSNEDLMAQAQCIIAKAWADDAFKAALLANPNETLAAEGITGSAGLKLKVLENTDDAFHLVLPAPPSDALSDEAVAGVAGGSYSYLPPMRLS